MDEWLYPFTPTPNQCMGYSINPTSDPLGCLARITNVNLPLPSFKKDLSYGAGNPDIGACVRELKTFLRGWYEVSPFRAEPTNLEWADLADSAEDGCRFCDITSMQYVTDVIRLAKSVRSVLKGDFSSLPKTWSDLWLSGRYGIRLTVSDTQALFKGVRKATNPSKGSTSHAMSHQVFDPPFPGSTYSRSSFYKLYYNYKTDPALVAIRTMMDWDLWPTWQNIWDIIPYSFVADWFVDVEGFLKVEDNNIYEEYINVESVLYTYKDILEYPASRFSLSTCKCVDARVTFYHRRHQPFLHYAPLRVQRGHLSTVNVVDGVTLLIQK